MKSQAIIYPSLQWMKWAGVIALTFLSVFASQAQRHTDIGVQLATNGLGLAIGAERPNDAATITPRLSLQINNLKDPRESRVTNPEYTNARPYNYQKVNSNYIARLGYGYKKNLSYSAQERPQLSIGLLAGPSLSALKPYYVAYENSEGQLTITTQNSETLENQERILGPARWSKGLDETSFQLGIHAQMNLNVKWNHSLYYKYWQMGVCLDYFPQGVDMVYNSETAVFTCLYTSYSFGRK